MKRYKVTMFLATDEEPKPTTEEIKMRVAEAVVVHAPDLYFADSDGRAVIDGNINVEER